MPNSIRTLSAFIPGGNPDTMNVAAPTALTGGGTPPGSFFPYAGGDLGASFDYNDKTYELVQLDSGATAATASGVVAANQLAYWKSKSLRIVTNNRSDTLGSSVANASGNFVAGIFRTAVGAGNLCCILARGHGIPVKSGSNTLTVGQGITSDVDANGPQVVGVNVGTAPGYMPLGYVRANNSGGNTTCDVDIPVLA